MDVRGFGAAEPAIHGSGSFISQSSLLLSSVLGATREAEESSTPRCWALGLRGVPRRLIQALKISPICRVSMVSSGSSPEVDSSLENISYLQGFDGWVTNTPER